MKIWIILLLVVPLLFAASDWRTITGLAVVTSAILLAIVYMIAYGFNLNELRFLSVEEFYQLAVTVLLVGLLVGAEAYFNDLARDALGTDTPGDKAMELLDERLDKLETMLDSLHGFSVSVGEESSKSSFCSMQGVGISIAPCGAYRGLATPVSFVYQMLGAAVSEMGALRALVHFGREYAFLMLLPAGILLRTFRLTRGAGGLLIAFAISIYLLLPLSVVAMRDITGQAFDRLESEGRVNDDLDLPDVSACNPFNPFEGAASIAAGVGAGAATGGPVGAVGGLEGLGSGNFEKASSAFSNLATNSSGYVYEFLINATLTAIVALTTMVAGTQQIARLAGSEVDVSALARVA